VLAGVSGSSGKESGSHSVSHAGHASNSMSGGSHNYHHGSSAHLNEKTTTGGSSS